MNDNSFNSISLSDVIVSVREGVKYPTIDSKKYSIDIYSPEDIWYRKDTLITIDSGVVLNIPEGHIGLILPVKELAEQCGLRPLSVFIPPGYNSTFTISLTQNNISGNMSINKDDYLLQIVLIKALVIC